MEVGAVIIDAFLSPGSGVAEYALERLGYRVKSATDPLEALEMIRANPKRFDLIITDMAMPHMTGDMLAAEIRKLNPGMPVILCTGYSDKIDPDEASMMGIRAFLQKPMDNKDLAECVRKVLDDAKAKSCAKSG